jgi:hypothetical protein
LKRDNVTALDTSPSLPAFLDELLEGCPLAGSGVNPWLYKVAKQLHAHMDSEKMFALLKQKTGACGRTVDDREIRRQIECARARAFLPKHPEAFGHGSFRNHDSATVSTPPAPASPWPEPNLDAIRAITTDGWGLYDLWESSPLRFDDDQSHTEEIIDVLLPDNPLLCCGLTAYQFATRRREIWRGHLARCAFITPNPMYKIQGLTLEGEPSQHCKSATAARIYLVVEFDFSEFARDGKTTSKWASLVQEWRAAGVSVLDATAVLHLHLSHRLPLVAAVHSGGKSLHGWYPAFAQNDDQLRPFMEYAVSLGADHVLWNRAQFSRMPGGRRENGKTQTCFYLNPGKAVH